MLARTVTVWLDGADRFTVKLAAPPSVTVTSLIEIVGCGAAVKARLQLVLVLFEPRTVRFVVELPAAL